MAFWRDSSTAAAAGSCTASLSAARVAARADMRAARMDGRMPSRTLKHAYVCGFGVELGGVGVVGAQPAGQTVPHEEHRR